MDLSIYQKKIDQALEHLRGELGSVQVGRASPGLIENINVEASYGHVKLNQIGHVTVMDNQTLKAEPWDKSEVKSIEKAIYDANIGLAPQNEGSYVIVKIPVLTQERRQELVKHVKSLGEETKATIRRIRQDAMKQTKDMLTKKEISEDEHKANEEDIEEIVKKSNLKIEEMVENKSGDLMKV